MVVASREKAEALGKKPLVSITGYASVGVEPAVMGIGPVAATRKILEKTGLSVDDIGLVELNEAFASQSLACISELGLDDDITNVNGGAIALGHPLGCTGAFLTTKLIHEMQERGTRLGMVTMCVGLGMGVAGIFEIEPQ